MTWSIENDTIHFIKKSLGTAAGSTCDIIFLFLYVHSWLYLSVYDFAVALPTHYCDV